MAKDRCRNQIRNLRVSQKIQHRKTKTIGTLPFPNFHHLYASGAEETGKRKSTSMNVARSNLNSCHLDIIEDQAKIIFAQRLDIKKLKQQNASLIAMIEIMNRQLKITQRDRKSKDEVEPPEQKENTFDHNSNENEDANNYSTDVSPDDLPLTNLTLSDERNESVINKSACEDSNLMDGSPENVKDTAIRQSDSVQNESDVRASNTPIHKSYFRIRFRGNNVVANKQQRRKRSKVVRRILEDKQENCIQRLEKPSLNGVKTVDEKLIADNAVLFLKTSDQHVQKRPLEENHVTEQEDQDVSVSKKEKSFRIPILTTREPYFTSVKEDASHRYNPVAYPSTIMEVPSFRMIEKDNVQTPDVPNDYYEDLTIEATKERHLRFEVVERKQTKRDLREIRELRRNEQLMEGLRKRKSRFSKMDPAIHLKPDVPESITTLLPDIRCMQKIIITSTVPVTALGVSIPKIKSWGSCFRTNWTNDGTVDAKVYEDDHHRRSKVKVKDTKRRSCVVINDVFE